MAREEQPETYASDGEGVMKYGRSPKKSVVHVTLDSSSLQGKPSQGGSGMLPAPPREQEKQPKRKGKRS